MLGLGEMLSCGSLQFWITVLDHYSSGSGLLRAAQSGQATTITSANCLFTHLRLSGLQ